jgi:hypothetical protein
LSKPVEFAVHRVSGHADILKNPTVGFEKAAQVTPGAAADPRLPDQSNERARKGS